MRPRTQHRCLAAITVSLIASTSIPDAAGGVPFSIQGPGVDSALFRMTEFASGLNFPVGMTELDDGSLLVAVSNGASFFGSTSGSLVRLADTDDDGLADTQTTLFGNVPGGKLTSVRRAGDLIFATGQSSSGIPISIFRTAADPADPLSFVGRIDLSYPAGGWLHPHSSLAVRSSPGIPGSYDLFFQLGSDSNFATTTRTANISSNIGVSGTISGDALHMLRVADNGSSIVGSGLEQIATGLRNAAGMAFHPTSGDLYLQDNGIDGLVDVNEPTSADELNLIPTAQIGGTVEDFGFPNNYVEYRTGKVIGGQGIEPLVAFQPIPSPNGAEAEGPNDIAFAPAAFPAALRGGIFVGFHGKFSLGGTSNEENPLVFVDLDDNSFFHFVSNTEAGVGHLDGLLSTERSLFVADIAPGGGLGSSSAGTGRIYQIMSLTPDLAADFDSDGDVDGNDFLIWQGGFGQFNGDATLADGDADGDVDGNDFLLWQSLFGSGQDGSAAGAVPEPTSTSLIIACLLCWGLGFRRASLGCATINLHVATLARA